MRAVTLALVLLAVLCAVMVANAEVSSSLQRLRMRVEGQATKVCRSRTTGEIVECNDNLEPIHPTGGEETPAAEGEAPAAEGEAPAAEDAGAPAPEEPYNAPVPQKPLDVLKPVHVPEPGVFPLQPGRPPYETGRVYTKEDAGRIAIVAALQEKYEYEMRKAAEAETLGYTFKHAGEAPEKGTEPVPKGRKRNQMPEGKTPNNLEPNHYEQLTGRKQPAPAQKKQRAAKGKRVAPLIEELKSSKDILG